MRHTWSLISYWLNDKWDGFNSPGLKLQNAPETTCGPAWVIGSSLGSVTLIRGGLGQFSEKRWWVENSADVQTELLWGSCIHSIPSPAHDKCSPNGNNKDDDNKHRWLTFIEYFFLQVLTSTDYMRLCAWLMNKAFVSFLLITSTSFPFPGTI